MGTDDNEYGCGAIQVLEGLEAVRRRPGMYLGNVHDGTALHHMLWEVVDNSLSEHLAGFGSHIEIVLGDDGSVTVTDSGRGIPVDIVPAHDLPEAEVVMTKLHGRGRFGRNAYTIKAGTYGAGLSMVNALCESLVLEIWREGKHWRQNYVRGIPQGPLTELGATPRHGTRITFMPDLTIFQNVTRFDQALIKRHLRLQAALFPRLTMELRHGEEVHVERCPTGVSSLVAEDVGDRPMLLPMVARFTGEEPCEKGGTIRATVALQWCAEDVIRERSDSYFYLNGANELHGGSPLRGIYAGMRQAVHRHAQARGLSPDEWKAVESRCSDRAVIVLGLEHPHPTFGGRTRSILYSEDAGTLLRHMMATQVYALLAEHPEVLTKLLAV